MYGMSSRSRSLSATRAQSEHSQTDHDEALRETYNRRPARGGMPPPPIPIDPAIDTWKPSTTASSSATGFDNLLHPSIVLPDRLSPYHSIDPSPQADEVHLPAMRQTLTEPDPLVRYYNEPGGVGPWNPQRILGEPINTPMNPQFPHYEHRIPRQDHAMQYGYRSPRSDVGSSTTGRYPYDSGYGGSKSLGTKSVRSADQLDQSPSSQSFTGDVRDLPFYHEGNLQDPSARSGTTSNPQYSAMNVPNEVPQSPSMTYDLTCPHQECGVVSKNQSEHSTNNDLDRHKKSVHKIMPTNSNDRSFRCAALNCPKREKIWPRLDNFRQHCKRIHPEVQESSEKLDELVRKSELDPGAAMEANDMANSSNHDAGDDGPGADMDEMTEYLNPSITFDHPMTMMPIQCGVDPHMQQAQRFGSLSPHSPHAPPNMNHYMPYMQHPITDQLLQVPGPKSPSKGPLSPSQKAFIEPNNVTELIDIGHSLRQAPKTKPLASTKKADQISEELASEIAKCINLSKGSPEDIQAAIKSRVLLALNPGCSKKLGSKNDWKRHENTQHYQIETWRCHEHSKSSPIGQCASIFYRREQFQGHLREKHHIEDDQYIQTQCKQHRIGRNGQGKFWCGFCQKIVELKTTGLDAWEERFRHIDDQHYKQGRTINDWIPLDGHVSKGVMGKGDYMESGSKDDCNNDDDGEDDESSNDEDESQHPQMSPRIETSPGSRADSNCGRPGGSFNGQARAKRRERIWHCVSVERS
ncbi:MAG: hypothetical protein Q9192_001346 [Flavoplaca navasiana]